MAGIVISRLDRFGIMDIFILVKGDVLIVKEEAGRDKCCIQYIKECIVEAAIVRSAWIGNSHILPEVRRHVKHRFEQIEGQVRNGPVAKSAAMPKHKAA